MNEDPEDQEGATAQLAEVGLIESKIIDTDQTEDEGTEIGSEEESFHTNSTKTKSQSAKKCGTKAIFKSAKKKKGTKKVFTILVIPDEDSKQEDDLIMTTLKSDEERPEDYEMSKVCGGCGEDKLTGPDTCDCVCVKCNTKGHPCKCELRGKMGKHI